MLNDQLMIFLLIQNLFHDIYLVNVLQRLRKKYFKSSVRFKFDKKTISNQLCVKLLLTDRLIDEIVRMIISLPTECNTVAFRSTFGMIHLFYQSFKFTLYLTYDGLAISRMKH